MFGKNPWRSLTATILVAITYRLSPAMTPTGRFTDVRRHCTAPVRPDTTCHGLRSAEERESNPQQFITAPQAAAVAHRFALLDEVTSVPSRRSRVAAAAANPGQKGRDLPLFTAKRLYSTAQGRHTRNTHRPSSPLDFGERGA